MDGGDDDAARASPTVAPTMARGRLDAAQFVEQSGPLGVQLDPAPLTRDALDGRERVGEDAEAFELVLRIVGVVVVGGDQEDRAPERLCDDAREHRRQRSGCARNHRPPPRAKMRNQIAHLRVLPDAVKQMRGLCRGFGHG
ncbi:MAG: hypothetical protein EA423_00360 [Phycisphaerales bacterium]|nr:MAG: hypothetical protein EA423_00360 [Phycisphaerales bacterium]